MSRARKLIRVCLSKLNRSYHRDCQMVLLHNVENDECVRLCLDSSGKLHVQNHESKFEQFQLHKNQQLYYQIIKSVYNPEDNSIVVKFQASLIPSNYNVKTVSDLTCANEQCCSQLFVSSLYKSKVKFTFATKRKTMLTFVSHKHGQFGNLYLFFDVVDAK